MRIGYRLESKILLKMAEKCAVCEKDMKDVGLTHCSEKCLFLNIINTKSIHGISIQKWP